MRLSRLHVLLLFAAALPAQETRSMIFGRVLDPGSAVVPGARVIVTNLDTGTSVDLSTNVTGYYEANLLLPGRYEVTVTMTGFKKAVRSVITLPISTHLAVDVKLDLGELLDTVTVAAETPLLDTSVVSSGRVLDNRSITDLPVMGNNPLLMVRLAPGVQTSGVNRYTNQGFNITNSEFWLPGRVGGNEWSIDGAPNLGPNRNAAFMPFTDTLQEFKVETSSFDASVGHATGVNVVMMTKTGTNNFHGSLTEEHSQMRWNGTSFFVKQLYYRQIAAAEAAGNQPLANSLRQQDKQASGRLNNWSVNVGGPVILPKLFNGKNRLFFFFSYNGIRDVRPAEPIDINRTIPTLAVRKGDFSQLLKVDPVRYQIYDPLTVRPDPARPSHFVRDPLAGNVLPLSRVINPVYNAYLKFLPTPNSDPSSPNLEPLNNYRAVGMPWNQWYDAYSNRVDYHFSAKHRFFGRWTWSDWKEDKYDWTYETLRGLQSNNNERLNRSGTVDWVYSPTGATVLDFTVAANDFREGASSGVRLTFKPSDVGLPAYVDQKAGDQHVFPSMSFAGYATLGQGYPVRAHYRIITTKLDMTHIRGGHSLRAGLDARGHFRTAGVGGNTSGSFSFDNTYTRRNDDSFTPAGSLGHSWAAFMMGVPSDMSIATNDSYATHTPYYAVYVQDNWRLTRRLSLNLGLRLEYEKGPTERFNRMIAYFDPQAALPITKAVETAYAGRPVPELAPAGFAVHGGSLYAGAGSAGRRIWSNELMWLPRLSAAWQLDSNTVIRAGYGLFFDTLNVLNVAPNQSGFNRNTSTTISNNFGMTWLAGDPGRGVSPLTDPFPVRSDGTRFDQPVGNALGLMALTGLGWTYNGFDMKHPRVQRWRLGVQRQIGKSMVFEAAYAGIRGDRIGINQRQDALAEGYWASGLVRNDMIASDLSANVSNPFHISNLSGFSQSDPTLYRELSVRPFFTSPTIRKNQLLRPFPHMNGLNLANLPYGKSRTDELQVILERRFAKGFNLNVSYSRLRADSFSWVENEFALPSTWTVSNNGRPHRFLATSIFELPFGKARAFRNTGWLSHLVGGWQFGLTYEWQPGPALSWPNVFYHGEVEDIGRADRTLDRWFNTEGFERSASKGPAAFHRRVFPTVIESVRADMTNQLNANILRDFRFGERWGFQLRLDALNLQNRSQFDAPSTDPYSTNFGKVTNQTATTNRWIQIQARLRF